ncbi:MAG: hypothetical protein JST75_05690 [Bacteroidetes bacterium]|nr:hypothetical protein [Bacteroidota bacterium]
MIDAPFKMSEKAFYRSRFSGILPCEILEIGSKKIRILIEGYNSKLWVSISRLMSNAEFALHKDNTQAIRIIKKITKEPLAAPTENSPAMEKLDNKSV